RAARRQRARGGDGRAHGGASRGAAPAAGGGGAVTLRPPDERPLEDLLGVRELFREEARAILDRLRRRLPELEGEMPDGSGLGDVVADGVALKGSAALVGLTVVSQAGVLVVRAAELAAERATGDPAGATALF